jgi:hypothetical protein
MSMDEYAQKCAEWLQSRVDQAEKTDPALRSLKDRINDLAEAVRKENSRATHDELALRVLLTQQNEAIYALIHHVAQKASHESAA